MRRLFLGVLTLTCVMGIGGAANGQITLIPGPPTLVAQSPKYIAVADFNNDKFDDAVVSNSVSSKVTVLFGQGGNSFGSVVDLNVGRVLRGVQAGDLNSDGIPDIAVVDLLDSRAFVVTSNGDGTFNQPVGYKVGLRPIDVGIGNFDRQKGNDLMTVDLSANKATVLLNQGGNKGFTNNGLFSVGKTPKRGETADLNGDGFDDIIVVNTGTAAADDVSVLLNTGSGSFQSTPPRNFVVGAGARDVAIADFNSDGALDLAVLNGGKTAVQNEFSVSILLNIVAGGRGTGFFSNATAVRISCPLTLGGIAVTCTPNFIAAGDFDNDGFIDFAVSFFTNSGTGVVTGGLITTYKGHGDGTFDFSSQVNVGADPQGIAAGDFNGDGVTDLVVAERGARSVRILTALKPPPFQNGVPCHVGGQCGSTFCTDGVCCSTASCPASSAGQPAQRCDIPDAGGICEPPAPLGQPCDLPAQCSSDFCVDGFCCSTRVCSSSECCNSGTCSLPASNGTPCNPNAGNAGSDQCSSGADQCNSGHCTDTVCCADDKCPAGQSCNIPRSEGVCTATLPPGQPCTVDAQCTVPTPGAASGFCTDLFCCGVRVCPTGQSCGISPHEGLCWPLPPSTPTLTPTPTATPIPTPAPNGSQCASPSQCVSGFCTDTVCCSAATCPQGQFCNISGFRGICRSKGSGECTADTDCLSGNCGGSVCAGTRTPTPTPTPKPGDPCGSETQCTGGGLHCTEGVCCTSAACDQGQSCTVPGSQGFCTALPTPAPTKSGHGDTCPTPGSGNGCVTGLCTNGVCCDTASCQSTERCDIFGSKGVCSPPLDPGRQCTLNTDCNADFGLLCLFCSTGPPDCATAGQYFCTVPSPTPVLQANTPTFTPTQVGEVIVNPPVTLTRSGGCSMDSGTDGRNVWWLAALPLIFWMRRARLHHARISRRRDWR
jgi:hypothetical protein